MIYVISTGWNAPTKQRCIDSVNAQRGRPFVHIYLEASEQDPPRAMVENLHGLISGLDPETIVVSLDGDDWLAHDEVLKKVQHMHDSGAWLTYGNFRFSDGRPSFVTGPYTTTDYRHEPWRATHLKTFRAGLFQKIKVEDLQWQGQWRDRGQDVAYMIPMLEMAGPARVMFCPEVLYVYNYATSFEFSAPREELAREKSMVADVRSKPPYNRIQTL